MKFIKTHHFALLFAVVIALLAFFGFRLSGESAKVVDVLLFAFFGCALLALPIVEQGDNILKTLAELVPKTGGTLGSVNCKSMEHEHDLDPRNQLELALIHSIGRDLVTRMDGENLGAYVRAAADALQGGGGETADQITEAAKDGVLHAAGYRADQAAEAEIVDAGLTAPRVTADEIQALMDKLTWHYEHKEGSRHTFAHAFLDDFYVATGHNAPVSRENFDAGLGRKYAREQGEGKARDELWKLEGYKLFSALN